MEEPTGEASVEPTISIVIPCYNYGRYLREAVESALAQTRPADEIIILNDGSTDDTLRIAQQLAEHPTVRVIDQPNRGAVAARNTAVRAATGAFVLRLDADDRLDPRYLERTIPILAADPGAAYAYTGYRYFGARLDVLPALPYDPRLLTLRPYILGTTLLRRAAFEAVGGYSTVLAGAYEDWDLYLLLAERDWHGRAVPEILYAYRQHPGSRNALTVRRWLALLIVLYRRHPSMRALPVPLFLARAVADRSWQRATHLPAVRRLMGTGRRESSHSDPQGGHARENEKLDDDEADLPLVTIVTPSFNQARYIERTLESVRTQDYPHIEHIVVDGGSTDGTQEILRQQSFAAWTSEPDRGQSDALNKGIARARGRIIGWLNSDDMYTPGAIRRAVEALLEDASAPFVYGSWDMVDDLDRFLEHREAKRSEVAKLINPPPGVIPSQKIGQPTVFMRAGALRQAGGIDQRLHMSMDYDLLVRLSALGPPAMVRETQALFRVSGESKTSFMPPAMWAESFAVISRYGDTRRAHHVLLPLFYYAILRGQSIGGARRDLLAAAARMDVPERERLDPRIVLGFSHWARSARSLLRKEPGKALAYALAAWRTGALRGPELAIVAHGVLVALAMARDRITGASTPLEKLIRVKSRQPAQDPQQVPQN